MKRFKAPMVIAEPMTSGGQLSQIQAWNPGLNSAIDSAHDSRPRRSACRMETKIPPRPYYTLRQPLMKLSNLSRFLSLLILPLALLHSAPLAVKVDVAKTGAPINPFIYGQFIEHMGRCIYGGIWAEMLEDRKFYFPITAEYSPYRGIENPDFPGQLVGGDYPVVGASPWQIIGEPAAVTMVKEGAFVGTHSPRLIASAGLRQRDLGLR